MPKKELRDNVFDVAVQRMKTLYQEGHRIVVSFSGGKDSTVVLEICLIAARSMNCLPVEVVMRDEEIMYPGTYEFAERTAQRKEISFNWFYANQPIINAYNRKMPFFWVFDPELSPDRWVRKPPKIAKQISEKLINRIVLPSKFYPPKGRKLYNVLGLRAQESLNRRLGIYSSGGYLAGANEFGVYKARPIYDWQDGDVWKAIHDLKWDYNDAYNIMARMGVKKTELRITPPTLVRTNSASLLLATKAWPQWFDRVCNRLDGVRSLSVYGPSYLKVQRHSTKTWKDTFYQECIENAPDWIRERAEIISDHFIDFHKQHSTQDLPDVVVCYLCNTGGGASDLGSWKAMTRFLFDGDPFCMKCKGILYPVDPEDFRKEIKKNETKNTYEN